MQRYLNLKHYELINISNAHFTLDESKKEIIIHANGLPSTKMNWKVIYTHKSGIVVEHMWDAIMSFISYTDSDIATLIFDVKVHEIMILDKLRGK